MKYTYLQYEYRHKWMHVSWCNKFFASDDERFDSVRKIIFDLKSSDDLIYPEAAARYQEKERLHSRRIISLYAGLGLMDGILN